VLTVALHHFTLRSEPVLGLAARSGIAVLVELVGAAPDLVFKVDGNNILTRFRFKDFKLLRFWRALGLWPDFGGCRLRCCDCVYNGNTGRAVDAGLLSARTTRFA
jgi:hypothetical protein